MLLTFPTLFIAFIPYICTDQTTQELTSDTCSEIVICYYLYQSTLKNKFDQNTQKISSYFIHYTNLDNDHANHMNVINLSEVLRFIQENVLIMAILIGVYFMCFINFN